MEDLAPILVLGYKRPQHLKLAIESLSANPEAAKSLLYIAIDGPKNIDELNLVEECRLIATNVSGFRKVITNFQTENIGLAQSVISNVSEVLSRHNQIIVVEDDLVVSKKFLEFMNSGLSFYSKHLNVASIHGFQYPLRFSESSCVFMRGADCWGWATWADRWEKVNFSSEFLIREILRRKLKFQFDLFGVVSNFRMLQDQSASKIDSWAIRWHASMFIQNMLTLFPPHSLVKNCGLDGSGTHEGISNQFDYEILDSFVWDFPAKVNESMEFRMKLIFYFINVRLLRLVYRVLRWPSKILDFLSDE